MDVGNKQIPNYTIISSIHLRPRNLRQSAFNVDNVRFLCFYRRPMFIFTEEGKCKLSLSNSYI